MRILAVDDDPFILELLPMIAAKAGFTDVTTTSSGELALEAITSSTEAFECLLFDINMPNMDGMELCARTRLIPAYRRTPIIMLTAMSEKDYLDNAFKAGATDYATKPFNIADLGARLRTAQELIRLRRDAGIAAMATTAMHPAAADTQMFDLCDAIQIETAADLIDYAALANYLAQKSRSGVGASQVIAVQIDRVGVICSRASVKEFNSALAEVADAADETLRASGYLMAYAGRGIFIIVTNATTSFSGLEIETTVQSLLDNKNLEYDSGDPLDIEVSIGNPIQPNVGSLDDVTLTFEQAIALAEYRFAAKRTGPRPLNIRMP